MPHEKHSYVLHIVKIPFANLVCVASPELAYKRSHLSCFKGCYLASLRRFCINVYYNVQMPRTFFFLLASRIQRLEQRHLR